MTETSNPFADVRDHRVHMLDQALDRVARAHEQEAAAIRSLRDQIRDVAAEGNPVYAASFVSEVLLASLNNSNRVGAIQLAINAARDLEKD